MTGDAGLRSAALLAEYAREEGRSVFARVETLGCAWEGGVQADESRPAASLLKVPLCMAVEDAFKEGRLDSATPVSVGELLQLAPLSGPLCLLGPATVLSTAQVLSLCISLSDRVCAEWLLGMAGIEAVRAVLRDTGCLSTSAEADYVTASAPLLGVTTARDAVRLVAASQDYERYPLTARALRHTVLNSRIPLGADGLDIAVAHKTGSLAGVANDVAVLECAGGTVHIAFLTEQQHDTLVAGYEMGICTRGLLEAWGLAVKKTRSLS